jgi:hypothetical protein
MTRSRDLGSLGACLKAAVSAGFLAGAIMAGFHSLLLDPLIERAIELEEHAHEVQGKPAKNRWLNGRCGAGASWGTYAWGPCAGCSLVCWLTSPNLYDPANGRWSGTTFPVGRVLG